MPSTVGIAAIRISPESLSLRLLISWRIARASPTMRRAQSSVRSPSGVNPWKREPRCTSITPRISSSCLRLVDMVGWVTPQASAARPKCRSFASASRSSSLSIKEMVPGNEGCAEVRNSMDRLISAPQSLVRPTRFDGQFGSCIASFPRLIGAVRRHLPEKALARFRIQPVRPEHRQAGIAPRNATAVRHCPSLQTPPPHDRNP